MYYASIGILALVIHIIINFEAMRMPKQGNRIRVKGRYRLFLISVMVFYVADFSWGVFYALRNLPLVYIGTVSFFVSMVVTVYLWTRFVVVYLERKSRFNMLLLWCGRLILIYQIVALIVNIFYPWFFYFTEDKEYVHGSNRYITLMIQMGIFFIAVVFSLLVARKSQDRKTKGHHLTIGISGFVMMVFITLQAYFSLMPFYSIGCLLTTCIIHSFIIRDEIEEQDIEMHAARRMAYRDDLTGVKNKLAYNEARTGMDKRIASGDLDEFGVVVFDLNGLKQVNDTFGHDAGDEYIKAACRIICDQFENSPIFRVGGDEFIALLEGDDYEKRDSLMKSFNQKMISNQKKGQVVVSSGLGVFRSGRDKNCHDVFVRADRKMYARKEQLKSLEEGCIA